MSVDLRIRKSMVSGDRHFSLDVAFSSKAKRIALFGPSGAGKSLTLRAVAGLLRPDAGRIEVNGRVLFDAEARVSVAPQARRVAYLFQDYALFPHLTVAQNIAFGSRRGWLNRPGARFRPRRGGGWTPSSWAPSWAAIRTRSRAARSNAWRWRAR